MIPRAYCVVADTINSGKREKSPSDRRYPLESTPLWHQTLQSQRAEGVQLVSFEEADAETALHAIAAEELPPAIDVFLCL